MLLRLLRSARVQRAAALNNAEVAQALLDAKADAAARTEKKMFGPGTALDVAVKHDRAAVRAVLDLG